MEAPLTPTDSPLTREDVRMSAEYQDLSTAKLVAGDTAFDFQLQMLDFSSGSPRVTGKTMRLSDYRGVRPVALIFGSYT